MTHGVFAGALRDALAFCVFLLGTPVVLGVAWDLGCWITREIGRMRRRRQRQRADLGIRPYGCGERR